MTMPSVNQIIEGLANEAKFLIKQAMGNAHSQYKVVQAENNADQIWHNMFGVAPVPNPDAPLEWDDMWNPNHPVAIVLKYIYQQESFVYHELNKAARYMDTSKLPTLGPFARAFNVVIEYS